MSREKRTGEHEELREALYNARDFIASVTAWTGQEDDQAEALAEIDRVLGNARAC